MLRAFGLFMLLAAAAVLIVNSAGAGKNSLLVSAVDSNYSPPVAVTIEGYSGHAMEPFLTRDARYLFFNNRNDPKDQTDIHVALRISDARFTYLGPLAGANSAGLDGVPSLDKHGRFFFVSNRDYDRSGNTLWMGLWQDAMLSKVQPLRTNFTSKKLLRSNIDMEISADGDMLYVAENRWDLFRGVPATSDIIMARRTGEVFQRMPETESLMRNINTNALEFAPSTSADQRTLYFTRLDTKRLRQKKADAFTIMVSTRPDLESPWGVPKRIASITGHVEGPTVTPDGCALYFHQNVAGRFGLYFTRTRACS